MTDAGASGIASDDGILPAPGHAPLAIVCGGGTIPLAVAQSAAAHGRRPVLFPVRGWAEPGPLEQFPHHWIAVGQAGRFRRLARAENCRDVVFVGSARRPALRAIRLDWLTLQLLPTVIRTLRGGDDHLLTGIAALFEQHGFHLIAAQDVAPEILVPPGPLGTIAPTARDRADIAKGLTVIDALGAHDIGQAVVVADGYVVAVEAAEGTDLLLERVADLRARGRLAVPKGQGVLVKAPKPGQDRRFDLPAIGPATVAGVQRAGLAGIAVSAGATVVAEPQQVARLADAAQVFVTGIVGRAP